MSPDRIRPPPDTTRIPNCNPPRKRGNLTGQLYTIPSSYTQFGPAIHNSAQLYTIPVSYTQFRGSSYTQFGLNPCGRRRSAQRSRRPRTPLRDAYTAPGCPCAAPRGSPAVVRRVPAPGVPPLSAPRRPGYTQFAAAIHDSGPSYTQFRSAIHNSAQLYTIRPPAGRGRRGRGEGGGSPRGAPEAERAAEAEADDRAVSVGGVRGRCIRRRTRGGRRGRAAQGVAVADAEAHPVAPVAGAVVAEGGEDAGEGTGGEAVAEAGLEGAAFGLRADRPPSVGRRRRRSPGRTGRSAPPRRRGRRTMAREDGAVRTGGFPGNPGGGRVRFRRRRSVPPRTPGRRRGPGSAGRRSGRPPAPGSGRRRRRSRRRG